MSIWDKTMLNLQKGHDKLLAFAATFSERVKAEITILRVRTQIDDVRDRIGEQQRIIGEQLLALRDTGTLPKEVDQLFLNSDVASAIETIVRCERDLENLKDELRSEARALRTLPPRKGGEGAS